MNQLTKLLHGALLLGLFAVPAGAEPLLYKLETDKSTVWLLGSVHALRADDYPLDTRIENAYANAERVVLELDPSQLNAATIAPAMARLAQFESGKTLADVASADQRARIRKGLQAYGLDFADVEAFEPWFIALQLVSLNLARHGYLADSGVDRHYGDRAMRDGKKTAGLETINEQLRLFDQLAMPAQLRLLLETIEDREEFDKQMTRIMTAWRNGDTAALAQLADEELGKDPQLRKTLLVDRNRNWAEQIPHYLTDSDDTLIIVGALHLVGPDGLVTLLRKAGYSVEQVD